MVVSQWPALDELVSFLFKALKFSPESFNTMMIAAYFSGRAGWQLVNWTLKLPADALWCLDSSAVSWSPPFNTSVLSPQHPCQGAEQAVLAWAGTDKWSLEASVPYLCWTERSCSTPVCGC